MRNYELFKLIEELVRAARIEAWTEGRNVVPDGEQTFKDGWNAGYWAAHDEHAKAATARTPVGDAELDGGPSTFPLDYTDMLDPFAERR